MINVLNINGFCFLKGLKCILSAYRGPSNVLIPSNIL